MTTLPAPLAQHLSPTGLLPPTPTTGFDSWWQLGHEIRHLEEKSNLIFTWLWGDWLRGLSRWPKQYDTLTGATGRGEGYRALEAWTGKPFGTLKNMAWLAGCYSTEGQPDLVRGLPNVRLCHFETVAVVKDKLARDCLLHRVSATGMTNKQLEAERAAMFPQLERELPLAPVMTGDREFEQTVKNHLLETTVKAQHFTIQQLNGNIAEARGLLEIVIPELTQEQAQIVQRAAGLLERRQEVHIDIIKGIWAVIEAYDNGEVGAVLEGVKKLAEIRQLLDVQKGGEA